MAQNCRFFDGNDKYGLEGHDCESEAGTQKDQTTKIKVLLKMIFLFPKVGYV